MNREFIKLNENNCLVTDENGSVNLIKASNVSNIEDIFFIENQLEYMNKELENYEIKIKELRISKITKYFLSGILSLLFLTTLIICVSKSLPLFVSIGFMSLLNIPVNIYAVLMCGTYSGIKKKLHALNLQKSILEEKLVGLEHRLELSKNAVDYKRYDNKEFIEGIEINDDNIMIQDNVAKIPSKKIIQKRRVLIKED